MPLYLGNTQLSAPPVPETSSFAINTDYATSSSQALQADEARLAETASFALEAKTATNADTASLAVTASYLVGTIESSSYALTASFLEGVIASASYSEYAVTASYLSGSITSAESASYSATSSLAYTASVAVSASQALTSSYAVNAATSSYVGLASGGSGSLSWNEDEKTAQLVQGLHTHLIGQEVQYNVRNNSGQPILKGDAVMAVGTLGASSRILVAPFTATGYADAKYFLGIASDNIEGGQDGKVTHFGKIRQVNTSAFSDGDILYPNPNNPGLLTNVEPTAPLPKIPAAIVIHAALNGTMFVRANQGSSIGESHDVLISGSLTDGQVLIRSASVWTNASAPSASYSVSSSYALEAVTASYVNVAQGALTASLAHTASYIETASYALEALTSSYSLEAVSSSYALEALTASYALSASYEISYETSSSFAETASVAWEAVTASYVETASYADLALTASYAISASFEIVTEESSSYAQTASYAETATTASYLVDGITTSVDTYISTQPVKHMITLTQAEYDAIGTKDANTFYIIV